MNHVQTVLAFRLLSLMTVTFGGLAFAAAESSAPFGVRFVDQQTQRGIPMVELKTVHDVRFVSDSGGWVCYDEPQHVGRTVFFHVRSQGYEVPKDGFGFQGIRCEIQPGATKTVALRRINLAERIYRITGADRYRDSLRLGQPTPAGSSLNSGLVAGQDSVQAVVYQDRIHWFWGDTNRLSYPLGLFRTAGATSPRPGDASLPTHQGIALTYFTGENRFAKAMVELQNSQGVVWIDGVAVVSDQHQQERMIAHYSRRPGLARAFEQGLLTYDDSTEQFESSATLPLDDTWRFPRNHPERVTHQGQDYLMYGNPFLTVRVPARYESVTDPQQYESWSCLPLGKDPADAKPRRDSQGKLDWRWQVSPPVDQKIELQWLKNGLIEADETRYLPRDAENSDRRVLMHSGTVRWNAFRKKWVMIGNEVSSQSDSPSYLGEVWYSESDSPQGPFRTAVRIVTHDRQSFYNPCHHAFLDEQDGRVIYFEGTYTNMFTRSQATPRYNYNQMMYRLRLDHPQLAPVQKPESTR